MEVDMGKAKKQKMEHLWHPQLFVQYRRCYVDVNILPELRVLWANNIETFYSCQGGPTSRRLKDGKIFHQKAYVQVYLTDVDKVCELLWYANPKVDKDKDPAQNFHRDRQAVRFKPSKAALKIPIIGDSNILGHGPWH
jgi:hypothetical protein